MTKYWVRIVLNHVFNIRRNYNNLCFCPARLSLPARRNLSSLKSFTIKHADFILFYNSEMEMPKKSVSARKKKKMRERENAENPNNRKGENKRISDLKRKKEECNV